jgi:hypothetical protein
METGGSLPHLQASATCPYPEPELNSYTPSKPGKKFKKKCRYVVVCPRYARVLDPRTFWVNVQTDTCAIWRDNLDNARFFPPLCGITCCRMKTLASDGNLWSYTLTTPLEVSSWQMCTWLLCLKHIISLLSYSRSPHVLFPLCPINSVALKVAVSSCYTCRGLKSRLHLNRHCSFGDAAATAPSRFHFLRFVRSKNACNVH